jgi:SAM-dependent methyltransferase
MDASVNKQLDYNQYSKVQSIFMFEFFDELLPVILSNLPSSDSLSIIDYGCSEGKNSFMFFERLLPSVLSRFPYQISLIFNDLPFINWPGFFTALQHAWISTQANCFVSIVAKSFDQQVVPDNSIDIGLSNSSFHWGPARLSHMINGRLNLISESIIDEGIAHYIRLLSRRYKELKPGGIIYISTVAMPSKVDPHYEIISDFLVRMLNQGLIVEEELLKFKYYFYILHEDHWSEILKGFEGKFEVVYRKHYIARRISDSKSREENEYTAKYIAESFGITLRDSFLEIFSEPKKKEAIFPVMVMEMAKSLLDRSIPVNEEGRALMKLILKKIS